MIALERAKNVAGKVIARLRPYCQQIEVAGSIRRRKEWVNDIDIVLVPSDLWNLRYEVLRLGPVKASGSKLMRVVLGSIQLDIYFATQETWATLLLIRTGPADHNIRLCSVAKRRGWRLAASGDGLFNERGERIAGDSEKSIYQALGLPYQAPWERG